jgi:hypothetical protein
MDKPNSKTFFRLNRKKALLFSEISTFTGGEAFQDGPFRVIVLFVTLVLLAVTIKFMMSSACISTSKLFDKF